MTTIQTPPTFEEARNRRQKVRSAGMDPNHWFAVEHASAVQRAKVVEVKFWKTSVAVYRDERGELHAIENRCAHRQMKLSLGVVKQSQLVCNYHGWGYNGAGELTTIAHDLFGKKFPQCKLRSYPVRERYGLVWVFFGDRERATDVPMPEIPELEGRNRWACVPLDFTFKAHHSMIIDNVSDFAHAYLHRKYRPFWDAKLTKLEAEGDRVSLAYDTNVGGGGLVRHFVDRKGIDTSSIELCYQYPYQWSNTDDQIKHWCLVLPIDERTTRAFFLFYFKSFKVPFTPLRFPRFLMTPILQIANRLHIEPLLGEDGWACEAEQAGYEEHYEQPIVELNPAVALFQALTVRKWEEHLAREEHKRARHIGPSLLKKVEGAEA